MIGVDVDWQAIGTAVGGLMVGAGGVALWWRKQFVETAREGAEVNVIQLMREEVTRLSASCRMRSSASCGAKVTAPS